MPILEFTSVVAGGTLGTGAITEIKLINADNAAPGLSVWSSSYNILLQEESNGVVQYFNAAGFTLEAWKDGVVVPALLPFSIDTLEVTDNNVGDYNPLSNPDLYDGTTSLSGAEYDYLKIPYIEGDTNYYYPKRIAAGDSVSILKHVIGLGTLTGVNKFVGDLNNDGNIAAGDAVDILKHLTGKETLDMFYIRKYDGDFYLLPKGDVNLDSVWPETFKEV